MWIIIVSWATARRMVQLFHEHILPLVYSKIAQSVLFFFLCGSEALLYAASKLNRAVSASAPIALHDNPFLSLTPTPFRDTTTSNITTTNVTTTDKIMPDTIYNLWCFVEGDKHAFSVAALSTMMIGELRKKIKEEKSNLLQRVDASSLNLFKVCYFWWHYE